MDLRSWRWYTWFEPGMIIFETCTRQLGLEVAAATKIFLARACEALVDARFGGLAYHCWVS